VVFSFTELNRIQSLRCVLCGEILANEGLKPAKLHRYLETKHRETKNKSCDYFQRQPAALKAQ
jgi:hypothetical protein